MKDPIDGAEQMRRELMKAALRRDCREAYDRLLGDFQKQGNDFHKQGKTKHAYAVQVLAISLIAPTQADPDIRAGNGLLDDMLGFLIAAYRKAEAITPKPN